MKQMREDKYEVRSFNTDFKGKLYLPVLARFLQETAWKHSKDLGLGYHDLEAIGMTWVLHKQMINMEEWPKWGDVITIKTWSPGMDRLFCYREFEIILEDKVIGYASSSWFVIRRDSRKPVRTSEFYEQAPIDISKLFFGNTIKDKIVLQSDLSIKHNVTVKLFDIDVNNHVNNSCYSLWCLDYYKPEYIADHELKKIELLFINEAKLGQELEIVSGKLSDTIHEHQILYNDKELFKMKLTWK